MSPRKLVDEEGNEVEVPTEEEIAALKADADKKVAEAQAAFNKEKEELEKQVNPNWKAMREKSDRLEAAIKTTGKEVDEQGNIVEKPIGLNKEEVIKTSEDAARKVYLDGQIASRLGQYDTETAKVVKHYFDKLTMGEQVTVENIDSFMKQAEGAASPERSARTASSYERGGVPKFQSETPASAIEMGEHFGNTPEDFKNTDNTIRITK